MTTPTPNDRMLADAQKSKIHYSAMKVEAELRHDDLLALIYQQIIDNNNRIIEICNRRNEHAENKLAAKAFIDAPVTDLNQQKYEVQVYSMVSDVINLSNKI